MPGGVAPLGSLGPCEPRPRPAALLLQTHRPLLKRFTWHLCSRQPAAVFALGSLPEALVRSVPFQGTLWTSLCCCQGAQLKDTEATSRSRLWAVHPGVALLKAGQAGRAVRRSAEQPALRLLPAGMCSSRYTGASVPGFRGSQDR